MESPFPSAAAAEVALYTITSPKATRPSVTRVSSRSSNRPSAEAERVTCHNRGLLLIIAANYGGRWDLTQAARALARRAADGDLEPEAIDEALLARELCLYGLPEPDLFVRTGGEQRISNFLLWQLAYTELYFAECMWPDFGPAELEDALHAFATRQRRFGRTGDQLEPAQHA